MALLLTKEKFCYYIGQMQVAWDKGANTDPETSEPFLIDELCMLLEEVMGDEDGVIGDYCFDCDFGRNQYLAEYPVSDIRSAEELYDYLVAIKEGNRKE